MFIRLGLALRCGSLGFRRRFDLNPRLARRARTHPEKSQTLGTFSVAVALFAIGYLTQDPLRLFFDSELRFVSENVRERALRRADRLGSQGQPPNEFSERPSFARTVSMVWRAAGSSRARLDSAIVITSSSRFSAESRLISSISARSVSSRAIDGPIHSGACRGGMTLRTCSSRARPSATRPSHFGGGDASFDHRIAGDWANPRSANRDHLAETWPRLA